jgi:hypothetical protein
MLFKIDALNTIHSIYEVNAANEEEAKNIVLGENSKQFLVENKIISTKIKSVNGKYTQTDIFYDYQ